TPKNSSSIPRATRSRSMKSVSRHQYKPRMNTVKHGCLPGARPSPGAATWKTEWFAISLISWHVIVAAPGDGRAPRVFHALTLTSWAVNLVESNDCQYRQ